MNDEITYWLKRLSLGDQHAAQAIWEAYFDKLVRLAHKKLGQMPRRAIDEEDVALSAMNSFFRGVEHGRFPRLEGADDIGRLLFTITARKACSKLRKHHAQRAGGGRVAGESVLLNPANDDRQHAICQVLGDEPTPAVAAEFAEQLDCLFTLLEDPALQRVASMKLEAYSNAEIASALGVHVATVERKLRTVRRICQRMLDEINASD